MAQYSIKEVEHLSGIKAHTLRIWEKRYNIIEPKRTETNIRYYDDEDLKKILNISVLNQHGFKISNIAKLSNEQVPEEILKLSKQDDYFSGHIESLIVSMIDFDRHKFDKIFNRSLMSFGMEKTMTNIIYPFFERIGVLWQTGNINPAQEHFISYLVREKIIVAIDDVPIYQQADSKNFCMFLPEGEWHELGLLFYSYFVRKYGHEMIYLGCSVPLESLKQTAKKVDFDYFVTSSITSLTRQEHIAYFNDLSKSFAHKTIVLLGESASDLIKDLPANFVAPEGIHSFQALLQ